MRVSSPPGLYNESTTGANAALDYEKGQGIQNRGFERIGSVNSIASKRYNQDVAQNQARKTAEISYADMLKKEAEARAAAAAARSGYGTGAGTGTGATAPSGGGNADWNSIIRQAQRESGGDQGWGATADYLKAHGVNIASGAGQAAMDSFFGNGGEQARQSQQNRSRLNQGFIWG